LAAETGQSPPTQKREDWPRRPEVAPVTAAKGKRSAHDKETPAELIEQGWEQWICGLEERVYLTTGAARTELRKECSQLMPCFLELHATRLTRMHGPGSKKEPRSEHLIDMVSRARALLHWSATPEEPRETPRFCRSLMQPRYWTPDKKEEHVVRLGSAKRNLPLADVVDTPRSECCSSTDESSSAETDAGEEKDGLSCRRHADQ
jgi:hypothetical protein